MSEHRPPPPSELTEEQAEEWRAIFLRQFPADGAGGRPPVAGGPLFGTGQPTFSTKQIEAFDPEWSAVDGGFQRYSDWLGLRARENKALTDLATKLRLTNQSRYTPGRAGTEAKRQEFGSIDEHGNIKLAPWPMHK